jgi:hypothetical protein
VYCVCAGFSSASRIVPRAWVISFGLICCSLRYMVALDELRCFAISVALVVLWLCIALRTSCFVAAIGLPARFCVSIDKNCCVRHSTMHFFPLVLSQKL